MIVSKHAGLRYKERIGIEGCERWGKDYTIRRVLEHIEKCRPVTDVEMVIIRKSKKNWYSGPDAGNARHLIDPDTFMVFVVVADGNLGEDTIITCYDAPYLRLMQEQPTPTKSERESILDAFQRAGRENSCMRWAVGLYFLEQDGFSISSHGLDRTLSIRQARGLLVEQVRIGATTSPKAINGGMHQYSWRKRKKNWCFRDFDILSPDAFDRMFTA